MTSKLFIRDKYVRKGNNGVDIVKVLSGMVEKEDLILEEVIICSFEKEKKRFSVRKQNDEWVMPISDLRGMDKKLQREEKVMGYYCELGVGRSRKQLVAVYVP